MIHERNVLLSESPLAQLGWDADVANLEHEATLPDESMPEPYCECRGKRTPITVDEMER